MANDGTVKISAEVDGKEFESSLSKLGGVAKKALAGATAAIGTITAATAAVGGAVVKATSDLAAYGDNIDKMSQKMGMSAEAYQEWDAVMQHSGTSIESMQAGMKTLASAAETGNKAFEKLGISQQELASMSQEELFSATITALQNVESETERTYLAGQLLGRGATELGALLNTSAEDTQKMKDRVHELGGVMSDEAVKAAAQYQDSLQDMQTAFSGLSRNMVSDFLPAVTQVMDGLTEIFAGNGETGIEMISQGVSDFANNLSETIPQVVEMGREILGALLSAIIDNLPQLIGAGTQAIVSLISGLVGAIPDLVGAAGEIISTLVSSLASAIPELAASGADVIRQLAQGFEQGLPELAAKIPEVIASAIDFLTEHLPEIVAFGVEIINSLVDGINEAIPAFVAGLPELINSFTAFIIEAAPLILDAGVNIIKNLIDGIVAAIPDLVAALPEIIDSIVGFLVEAAPQILSTGAQLILALIGGIVSAIPDLVAALPQIISAIADGLMSLLGGLADVGLAIVQAIWDGIVGGIKSLLGIGGGDKSSKSGGKSARSAAVPMALSEGDEGGGISTYALSRSSGITALEGAVPSARDRMISDLAAAMPAAQSRVAIATAAMAPSAGYSAPPPVSSSGGGGNGQTPTIVVRPQVVIKAEGDLAPLAQLFKPALDAEDARVGQGVQ